MSGTRLGAPELYGLFDGALFGVDRLIPVVSLPDPEFASDFRSNRTYNPRENDIYHFRHNRGRRQSPDTPNALSGADGGHRRYAPPSPNSAAWVCNISIFRQEGSDFLCFQWRGR